MSEVKYKAVKNAGHNCDGCHHYETTKNKENIRCYAFIENRLKEGLPDCCGEAEYIYQLDTPKVTLEQAREKFENHIKENYRNIYLVRHGEEVGECFRDIYKDNIIQGKWHMYQQALKDFGILEEGE